MAERKKYDWEAIEKEFRSGQLSIREIAKLFEISDTAIRTRMKGLGIERDLSVKVAEKVRTDLIRGSIRTANPQTEKDIVNEAAARAVEVIRSHQKRIRKGGEIVEKLLLQLEEIADNREEIEEDILEETKKDISPDRRNRMLRAVALQSNASTAVSLSLALKNFIDKDREAFSLNNEKHSDPESLLQEMMDFCDGKSKGLPHE